MNITLSRSLALVAFAALTAAATACAGAPSSSLPSSQPKGSPASTPASGTAIPSDFGEGLDVCALLSASEATELAGQPMQTPKPTSADDGAPGCVYRSVDATESFSIVTLTVRPDNRDAFENNAPPNATSVPSIGDRAYVVRDSGDRTEREIDVLVGDQSIRMTVQGRMRSAAALREAAKDAAKRLGR